jgi:hypothetical protein
MQEHAKTILRILVVKITSPGFFISGSEAIEEAFVHFLTIFCEPWAIHGGFEERSPRGGIGLIALQDHRLSVAYMVPFSSLDWLFVPTKQASFWYPFHKAIGFFLVDPAILRYSRRGFVIWFCGRMVMMCRVRRRWRREQPISGFRLNQRIVALFKGIDPSYSHYE